MKVLPIVLRLEIDHRADPIHGRLVDPAGVIVPFQGWLGLAAAIVQAADLDAKPRETL